MTVKDILDLEIPLNFGSDEDGEQTYVIEEVYSQLDNTVKTAYGASKFIIFLNDKEVIKIPFNGCFWYDCELEQETGDPWRFDEFIHKDYCAIEEEKYDKAVDAGLEKFFASTQYCGNTKNNVPVYISERVCTFFDNASVREKTDTISENSWEKAKSYKKSFNSKIHEEWLARAIEYYGEDAVSALLDFIKKENIYDLHTDNIGFRYNGAPVILDYSSYNEF